MGYLPSDDEYEDESDDEYEEKSDDNSGNVDRKQSTSVCDDDDSEDDDSVVEEELDMETFCFCHVANENEHEHDEWCSVVVDDDGHNNDVIVDSVEQGSERQP